jgi:hypothetical protein
MKMVSAAKYARAEKALKDGRANGPATQCIRISVLILISPALLQKAKVDLPEADKQVRARSYTLNLSDPCRYFF